MQALLSELLLSELVLLSVELGTCRYARLVTSLQAVSTPPEHPEGPLRDLDDAQFFKVYTRTTGRVTQK